MNPELVISFSENGYTLCIQKYLGILGDTTNIDTYVANIVAASMSAGVYTTENVFSWTDGYKFAASKQAYKEGDSVVEVATAPPQTIDPTMRDKFVLTNWNEWNVEHYSIDAPPNGFAFSVGDCIPGPGASAVVYLDIAAGNGAPVTSPFYMSPTQSAGGSLNQYLPREQVLAFFNKGVKTGSMITGDMIYPVVVDMTQEPNQTWELETDGTKDSIRRAE
ncbi:hypothetical protein H0H93_007302 [Arthromyces matolae]|nr:hypothetical protein H0H93_007302 [Arthromyces matolae]